MPKKKNGTRKLFSDMPVEPEHSNDESMRPTTASEEQANEVPENQEFLMPVTSDADLERPEKNADSTESVQGTQDPAPADAGQADADETPAQESSADDLLEDMRRSLIEEAKHKREEEKPKWWKRIGKGSRKKDAEPQPAKPVEEISLPESVLPVIPEDKYVDEIDELIDLLDAEETAKKEPIVEEPAPLEPEKAPDIEALKKQAFQPRPSVDAEESLTEVRTIALEGDEEVFVEVESKPPDALEERVKAVENALTPYRRLINVGIVLLGLVMATAAALALYNIYEKSIAAQATPPPVSNLPFPELVSLPGGWTFQLGKGSLVDGKWDPKGAEWLQGTEVCRWVALPWSRQLEAVIRTLNPDDPVELGMSNHDTLVYKVYSIKQMSPEELLGLDSNTPCLLIVLAEPEAQKRWVLTAIP